MIFSSVLILKLLSTLCCHSTGEVPLILLRMNTDIFGSCTSVIGDVPLVLKSFTAHLLEVSLCEL